MRINYCLLGIFLTGFIAVGCATAGNTGKAANEGDKKSKSAVEVNDSSMSLADYLQQVPGVQVQQAGGNVSVNIRGSQSVNSSNEPLFVIDGQRAGHSYMTVSSMVSVNDIDYVEVLKGSEAKMRYGFEGSNGVIRIITKKKN